MKRAFAVAVLLFLAACGREPAKTEAEPAAAPASLKQQADAMSQSEALQLVLTQVRSGPGGPRPCQMVNQMDDMGVIPADVASQTVFAQHVGARAFSVQCTDLGQLEGKTVGGASEWLVLLPADSMTAVVIPCVAEPGAANVCWAPPPRQAATTTPISAPASP